MVAQVIKLPSVATNNFQSKPIAAPVKQFSPPTEIIQTDEVRTKKIAEQATQNIKTLHDAAKVLNEFVEKIQTNLNFSIDEGSGRSVITVTDKQTGDIIRQIPAKEVLAVANIIRESAAVNIEKVGLLLARTRINETGIKIAHTSSRNDGI